MEHVPKSKAGDSTSTMTSSSSAKTFLQSYERSTWIGKSYATVVSLGTFRPRPPAASPPSAVYASNIIWTVEEWRKTLGHPAARAALILAFDHVSITTLFCLICRIPFVFFFYNRI